MWVGRVVGPEESRGCAERWRGSGEGQEEVTKTQDDRRVMPSQRWVVQRAQAGGELRQRGGEPRQKESSQAVRGPKGATHSAKANVASPRGGGYWRDRKSGPPGVCVWRACSKTKQKGHEKKKTARGRESEGRNKRVVGEGGTTSASETWGAARRAEGPPWCGRGHCQVGVA